MLWFLLSLSPFLAPAQYTTYNDPESEILVIEDFITPDIANALITYYDNENIPLKANSDNQIIFTRQTDPKIRDLISAIATKAHQVMKQSYGLPNGKYHVDHCALYSRIRGNCCSYHADNCQFYCPIHGKDQSYLRSNCSGHCANSYYLPNHTPWREYTALLYLNDGFEGGELVFEDGPHSEIYKKVIPIKGNMLVISPNGPQFYHEVLYVKSGKRYSLHIWYTSDNYYTHDCIRAD